MPIDSPTEQMASAVLQVTGQNTMPLPTRTPSGGFKTADGTLYVSKPFRSSSSQKLKAMIAFTPRKSHFDIGNERSGSNEFRGFFTLFWISMFLFAIRTYIWSLETNGYALDFAFATMFSKDGLTLAISDFVLVLSTAICVPFAKAIKKGYIRYNWTGLVLQHAWQMTVLFVAIKWAFNRHWPWVQSGYLTLHSLVMIMKMHSYMSTNGYLQSVHIQSQQTLSAIHRLAEEDESIGGYENAMRVALEKRKQLDELTERQPHSSLSPSSDEDSGLLTSSSSPTPTATVERLLNSGYKKSKNGDATPPQAGTPMVPEGSSSAFIDPRTAAVLRHRLNLTSGDEINGISGGDVSGEESDHSGDGSVLTATTDSGVGLGFDSTNSLTANGNGHGLARTSSTSGSQEPSPIATSFPPSNIPNTKEKKRNSKPTPHPLVDHPDERISNLAKEYTEMEGELTGIGPEYVRWPENITYKNFAVYQLVPTLVYELEYPRTDRIRPLYVFEKTAAFFGTFALLYTVTERFILPFTPSPDQSFFRSLLDLALPFMVAYLLLFYIIFALRIVDFMMTGWNSTSWDEFSRKWNRPVHTFLLRHVYASTMTSYKLSRQSAMFLTFLLSAAVHELVMAIVTKKIRMYLFVLQLAQIPLIAVGKIPAIKRNKLLGNVVFWLGLYAGFPLLCVAYCAY